MKTSRMISVPLFGLLLLAAIAAVPAHAADKPLRVYVLVGQSNMQGHAHVRTIAHLAMDQRTAPLHKQMVGADGKHVLCKDVWISSIGSSAAEKTGRLTAGYGAEGGGPKIGPEFTFGITMQKLVDEPILIIKTAWGGKSLHTDFRPPSAGPYVWNEQQLENLAKRGTDLEKAKADRVKATGHYYRLTIEHVQRVLRDIKRVYPDYDAEAGYELSGMVWFQGWNDMVDSGVYPNRDKPGGYDQYSQVLTHFIADVRKDLKAPKLPFVIGVMGVGGPIDQYGPEQQRYKAVHGEFRNAMAAPATLPEFKGNVAVVQTSQYWDAQLSELSTRWNKVNGKRRDLNNDKTLTKPQRDQLLEAFTAKLFTSEERQILEIGKSNAEYHYLGSAKILGQVGKAFAEAVHSLN